MKKSLLLFFLFFAILSFQMQAIEEPKSPDDPTTSDRYDEDTCFGVRIASIDSKHVWTASVSEQQIGAEL